MKGITEKFKEINLKGMSLSEALALARENSQTVKKCILGLLLIICLVLFVFGGKDEGIEVEAASGGSGDILVETGGEIGTAEAGAAYGSALPAGEIFVDVQGAVENPGVVRLTEGARVFQAIEAAGGVVSMGDTSLLNLALRLNDGDKLYVPFAGESVTLADGTQVIAGSAASAAAGGAALISGSGDLGTQSGKININTATSEELQTLSGIGIVTAGKIVDYRSQNGRFVRPEDIKNVSGIGERTYESIKDDICV
jgi:competence protein ComEA